MPAKHRRPESQGPSWGLIASIAALLLVLAGIGAAAFLLWNKFFVPSKPAVSPTPAPTAPPGKANPQTHPPPKPQTHPHAFPGSYSGQRPGRVSLGRHLYLEQHGF